MFVFYQSSKRLIDSRFYLNFFFNAFDLAKHKLWNVLIVSFSLYYFLASGSLYSPVSYVFRLFPFLFSFSFLFYFYFFLIFLLLFFFFIIMFMGTFVANFILIVISIFILKFYFVKIRVWQQLCSSNMSTTLSNQMVQLEADLRTKLSLVSLHSTLLCSLLLYSIFYFSNFSGAFMSSQAFSDIYFIFVIFVRCSSQLFYFILFFSFDSSRSFCLFFIFMLLNVILLSFFISLSFFVITSLLHSIYVYIYFYFHFFFLLSFQFR